MEPQVDAPGALIDEDQIHANRPIEHLDIQSYAARYTGRTKISRLLFIADKCGVPSMHLEALRIAYDEIKKGVNTQLFTEVVTKIDGRLGPNYGPDTAWVNAVCRRTQLRKKKLKSELNAYRTYLIKESIRMGYNDFGDFYYARGRLGDALRNHIRTRDYCTTSKHIISMYLKAILVSIEMGQFGHVTNYVDTAEQRPDILDPVTIAKLHCAAGLAHLEGKRYNLAARKFLETSPELGNNYKEVIVPQDIATYCSLCALATFDRAELKSKVIDNMNFRIFLELVPEIRELLNDFHASHYASCLEHLGNLKANLLLDIHLHDHVETLYEQIRNKALIQYTLPFVSLDLHMMANAFNTSVMDLEKEIKALITKDRIQARIDSQNKILYARHADQRNNTFQHVLQAGSKFDQELRAMLLRANIIKHDCNFKRSRKR